MSWLKDIRQAVRGFAALAESRSSLENPKIPISSKEIMAYFEGMPTSTGLTVNEDKVMGVAAILSVIRVLAEGIAALPLETYRRTENGGRERATDHPAYRMLKLRPNPFMSAMRYYELAMKHVVLRGRHYAEIQFDSSGYPVAFWPLSPTDTEPVYTERESLVYVTTIGNERVGLPDYRVLHISALGDGIKGGGLLDYSRETAGYAAALDQYQGKFFANGAHTNGFLKHPATLTDSARERLKSAWKMAHGGLSNAHRTAVLEEGVEWVKTAVSPEEAQAIEARKLTRSEIAGLYRVSAHFINDLEHATFSNVEELNISHVVHAIRPWAVRFEQEMDYKLFAGEPQMYVKFNLDALLRGDRKSRSEALEIERRNGVLTANEWRELENRNPVASPYGDSFMLQVNNALVGADGRITPLSTSNLPRDRSVARKIAMAFLRDSLRRVASREKRAIEKHLKSSEAQAMGEEAAVRSYCMSADWIEEVLYPAIRAANSAGLSLDARGYPDRSIEQYRNTKLDRWEERRINAELATVGGFNAET